MIRSAEYEICCSVEGDVAGATAEEDVPRREDPLIVLVLLLLPS